MKGYAKIDLTEVDKIKFKRAFDNTDEDALELYKRNMFIAWI